MVEEEEDEAVGLAKRYEERQDDGVQNLDILNLFQPWKLYNVTSLNIKLITSKIRQPGFYLTHTYISTLIYEVVNIHC